MRFYCPAEKGRESKKRQTGQKSRAGGCPPIIGKADFSSEKYFHTHFDDHKTTAIKVTSGLWFVVVGAVNEMRLRGCVSSVCFLV